MKNDEPHTVHIKLKISGSMISKNLLSDICKNDKKYTDIDNVSWNEIKKKIINLYRSIKQTTQIMNIKNKRRKSFTQPKLCY